MKPFNLEAAKAGAVVQTRLGSYVRIICFDFQNQNFPLVALIKHKEEGRERIETYTTEGMWSQQNTPSSLDLFMAPTKKSGWINIYKNGVTSSQLYGIRELAIAGAEPSWDLIDTVMVEWVE